MEHISKTLARVLFEITGVRPASLCPACEQQEVVPGSRWCLTCGEERADLIRDKYREEA